MNKPEIKDLFSESRIVAEKNLVRATPGNPVKIVVYRCPDCGDFLRSVYSSSGNKNVDSCRVCKNEDVEVFDYPPLELHKNAG